MARGFWKLSDFKANEKFGFSLAPTVQTAKRDYGVRYFYVWHAAMGYWGGIDPQSPVMKPYSPSFASCRLPDDLRKQDPVYHEEIATPFGMADPEKFGDFYDGYHTYLEKEGVDGVKIDVQGQMEGFGAVCGGRLSLIKAMRKGMEASVRKHFHGGLINCMSCNNDTLYHLKDSNLTRSSNDFFPAVPDSHAKHIYDNAVNSIFMSPFTYCDWDMFQTAHPMGEYHAAARAVSGSPVYVSDRVGEHCFAVIRDLTDEEGKLFLAKEIARPLPKSLFRPFPEGKNLFHIFNCNENGFVVGSFSPQAEEGERVCDSVKPSDIPGAQAETFAVYRRQTGESATVFADTPIALSLASLSFELTVFSPVQNGFALLGITEKYNVGGTVGKVAFQNGKISFPVKTGGTLLFYSEKPVAKVHLCGKPLSFARQNGFYRVTVPASGEAVLEYRE